MGDRLSATKLENTTATASVMENSANNRPVSPGMNEIGTNTARSTSVVATTAKETWRVPR